MAKNSSTNNSGLPKNTRIAIFYDWLNQWGGAEQVLLDILKIYPQADIFTLVHDPKKTNWLSPKFKVKTSFINKLPLSKRNPIFYTPLYLFALRLLNFKNYDLVISTTSTVGHYLKVPKSAKFVCYIHNINRYLYETPSQFSFLKPILNVYKIIDKKFIKNPDLLISNSKTVQNRIKKNYNRDSQIVNPGIDTEFFKTSNNNISDYFLIVSRLVKHKRLDIAINACQNLNKKLIVIGSGRDKNYYQKISNPKYIKFVGNVLPQKLKRYYQNSIALLCPQIEDFGISPLECNACGKPVIALNKGGIKENIKNNIHGILFEQQNIESLSKAINQINKVQFDKNVLHLNAKNFSKKVFYTNFKSQILKLIN